MNPRLAVAALVAPLVLATLPTTAFSADSTRADPTRPVTTAGGSAPIDAGTEYRYWSFWRWEGGRWVYATVAPGMYRPEDGTVTGWRFATSREGGSPSTQPRRPGDFTRLCGEDLAEEGQKRVGVLIDFGTPDDAPGGERPSAPKPACARVHADATALDALYAVARPRFDRSGLVCGIDGYPRRECGARAAGGSGQDEGADEEGVATVGALVGGLIVFGLLAAAILRAKAALPKA